MLPAPVIQAPQHRWNIWLAEFEPKLHQFALKIYCGDLVAPMPDGPTQEAMAARFGWPMFSYAWRAVDEGAVRQ